MVSGGNGFLSAVMITLNSSIPDPNAWTNGAVAAAVMHELGHGLGLQHQPDVQTPYELDGGLTPCLMSNAGFDPTVQVGDLLMLRDKYRADGRLSRTRFLLSPQ